MIKLSSAELPLKGGIPRNYTGSRKKTWKGPLRAIRLCLLGIFLPALLLSVPLYLRFRVYDNQLYPIGMSDMRLIDNRVSTTWCQNQLVKSNTTFNAFLMAKTPTVSKERIRVEMTRHLKLSDDMKEYWGFYLLKGSKVTVTTCARWPGSSLILIRGHRHLHECAYIGDNSSEEMDELMARAAEQGIEPFIAFNYTSSSSEESPSNHPDRLKKFTAGVVFKDPNQKESNYTETNSKKKKKMSSEETMVNAKDMRALLEQISLKAEKMKPSATKHHKTFDNIHKHRETVVGKSEENNVKLVTVEETMTSSEVFNDVLKKLQKLGPRGKEVLEEIRSQMDKLNFISIDDSKSNEENLKGLVDKIVNSKEFEETTEIISTTENLLRLKRQLILKTASKDLNEDDERGNLGIEEGFTPDEHADHHVVLNQTDLNDRSNSEFWSSFSSSEEALLNCAGLILSLPLASSIKCEKQRSDADFEIASFPNTMTYTVPMNGYYFFVFNSENEVQENFIKVHFDLEKTAYNVTNPLAKCSNSSDDCSLPLDFFSNEKVVFELPLKNNDSLWNEEFIVISECVPRTSIYLVCLLLVPFLILVFAFQ